MGDFIKQSVYYGLKMGEFDHLDNGTKRKLIRLMARISEKSYRRGFHHGKVMEGKTVDPEHFRYYVNLGRSPFTDAFYPNGKWAPKSGISAIERLFAEYPLWEIGFNKGE